MLPQQKETTPVTPEKIVAKTGWGFLIPGSIKQQPEVKSEPVLLNPLPSPQPPVINH